MELRKADKRKLIYRGKTAEGKNIDIPLLLPPLPNSESREEWLPDDELSAAGFDVFKIDLGGTAGVANQKKVYDFVKSHMANESVNYVVSAVFDEGGSYGNYLVNLVYVMSGFNQIYEERAQEMFGKDYYSIGKEEYAAVRLGVPMAISVADVKMSVKNVVKREAKEKGEDCFGSSPFFGTKLFELFGIVNNYRPH